ncbi:hypothetical protein AYO44_03480 [Planctomycetaceae bacterium SCGC AG-212-F19]|nr:hypothetical protein AYO44_03480 [Planctomycetaceae bacterium SCGC AG-212-F19]
MACASFIKGAVQIEAAKVGNSVEQLNDLRSIRYVTSGVSKSVIPSIKPARIAINRGRLKNVDQQIVPLATVAVSFRDDISQ